MARCGYEWRSPRTMTSTSGEVFKTLPVNHSCGEEKDHLIPEHRCPCGEESSQEILLI